MPRLKFIAKTLTSTGTFEAGSFGDFTEAQAKDLLRLTSVEVVEVPKKKKKK